MSSDGKIGTAPPSHLRAGDSSTRGFAGTGDLADARGVDFGHTPDPSARTPEGRDFSPKDVIGNDDRTRVTATTTYPDRAIGLLLFDDPAGDPFRCTAWLYDESTVVTAGHCVYTHDNTNNVHGWNSNFRFYPGRNADQSPYGSCGWSSASSVNGWIDDNNAEYDYGAVVLNCSVGSTVGWFGLHWQSAGYDGTSARITGYPGDKTPTYSSWTHAGPITSSAARQLFYQIDTAGGQSGSPVYISGCGAYCGIAIHAYGRYGGSTDNRGTRITEAAFNNYMAWRP